MPVLLCAQQVARAANFQIAQGDLKARAEGGVFTDGGKPLGGDLGERLARTVGEIGVRLPPRAPHAAADLVQLGKPQPIGILNDERIGVRQVYARLHDGGAEDHVKLPAHKRLPDVLQLLAVGLAVRGHNARLGQGVRQLGKHPVHRVHAVVEVDDLPAPPQLAADGLGDHEIVVLHHVGLYGMALAGRLVEERHIADAAHRHIQRARNGRCRQGQDVHVACHFLQLFLLRDPEALLLVYDEQPKVAEFYLFRQQLVRTDENVDLPTRKAAQDGRRLLGRAEAREHLHRYGEAAQAGECRFIVLHSENGRRHENGDLLAVRDRLEGGAQGNLGLAVAHVTAQKAVHRGGALHIPLDLLAGGDLSVGLLVGEGGFKLGLHRVVGREGVPRAAHTRGVERDQLLCHIACGLLGAPCGAPPFRPAHTGELGGAVRTRRADVFGDHFKAVGGQEQFVRACVADGDVIPRCAVHGQRGHPVKATDAVHRVHDEIPLAQVGVGKEPLPRGGALAAHRPLCLTKLFLLGHEREDRHTGRGQVKAARKLLALHERVRIKHPSLGQGKSRLACRERRQRKAILAQARRDRLLLGAGGAHEKGAIALVKVTPRVLAEQVGAIGVGHARAGAEAKKPRCTRNARDARKGVKM